MRTQMRTQMRTHLFNAFSKVKSYNFKLKIHGNIVFILNIIIVVV